MKPDDDTSVPKHVGVYCHEWCIRVRMLDDILIVKHARYGNIKYFTNIRQVSKYQLSERKVFSVKKCKISLLNAYGFDKY
jgi:hypothetical protein